MRHHSDPGISKSITMLLKLRDVTKENEVPLAKACGDIDGEEYVVSWKGRGKKICRGIS